MVTKVRLVIRRKDQAYDFFQQFVGPRGKSEGAFLAIAFRDVDSLDWTPHIPFISQGFNDGHDFVHGHTISRFLRDSWCHGPSVPINLPLSLKLEFGIRSHSVYSLRWSALQRYITKCS